MRAAHARRRFLKRCPLPCIARHNPGALAHRHSHPRTTRSSSPRSSPRRNIDHVAGAMACAAVASSVSAALAPTHAWESMTLSRRGLALAAPAPRAATLKLANRSRVVMSAAPQSDNKVATLTGLALLAAVVVPEIAEAAQPGFSPSLKNLLLSVVAGGTVLTVIGVAVAGVSTFDPVKRK